VSEAQALHYELELTKRKSMAHVTQADCDAIAAKLNPRPRKRLGHRNPEECYARA
jgi:IS30 family transposase